MRLTVAMFSAFYLLMGMVFCGLLVLCVPALVLGIYFKKRWILISSLSIPAGYLALYIGFLYLCDVNNPYPTLETPPEENRIAGTYKLSEQGRNYVRQLGYNDVDATLVLKEDHTCSAINYPRGLLFGEIAETHTSGDNFAYYDGAGTWRLTTTSGYAVDLYFHRRDIPPPPNSKQITATIIAPKDSRKEYALRVWVWGRADDEVYFIKQ
jgi:hypothetical protein